MANSKFDRAREIYLPGFVRGAGFKVKEQGKSFGSNFCPRCGQSDNVHSNKVSIFLNEKGQWRWNCFTCCLPAASPIDYAAALWDTTAVDAVERILQDAPAQPANVKKSQPRMDRSPAEEAAVTDVISKITRNSGHEVGIKYLMGRAIHKSVIDEAALRGIFCSFHDDPRMAQKFLEAHCGLNLLEKSGFKKQGSKWCAIAFRPVVFPLGRNGAEFRLASTEVKPGELKAIRYGNLSFPSFWKADSDDVLIVEGAIDMLSCVSMGWKGDVMGIPGVSSYRPEWFAMIRNKNPKTVFHLGLDPDKAGFEATMKMSKILEEGGYKHKIIARQTTMDWNEALIAGARF